MRILIYGINYAPELTGIGKYTSEMTDWLASRGHSVRVVTAPPYYPSWSIKEGYLFWKYLSEEIKGVKVFRCPLFVPRKPSGTKRLIHLTIFAFSSLPVLIWQALWWQPAVIWVVEPTLFCAPGALITSFLIKAKSWLHVQDFEVDAAIALGLLRMQKLQRVVKSLESWLLQKFDKVSTISERMLFRLREKGVKVEQGVKFPNWVNTELIYPLREPSSFRKELKIPVDQIIALYSGNMGEKQGLEALIDAARCLKDNKNIQFILCGEGSTLPRLLKLAEELSNIQFLPLQPIQRLNDLLNLADIHLLPQRADVADLVLPSKLCGMLASGRPVIATACSGTEIAETLRDCGILVSPENIEALVQAILGLANNTKTRLEMGMLARSFACAHWSQKKVLGDFEKELIKLTAL